MSHEVSNQGPCTTKNHTQSSRWTLLHAPNSQEGDVRAKEQVPSGFRVPKPTGSLYSLPAAGAAPQHCVPGATDTPGIADCKGQGCSKQIPVTCGDLNGGRKVLGARGQTTFKGNKQIPKLLSSSTVPVAHPAQGLTFSSTE